MLAEKQDLFTCRMTVHRKKYRHAPEGVATQWGLGLSLYMNWVHRGWIELKYANEAGFEAQLLCTTYFLALVGNSWKCQSIRCMMGAGMSALAISL